MQEKLQPQPVIQSDVTPEDPKRHGRFNVNVAPNVITDQDGELIFTIPKGVNPYAWVDGLKFLDD